MFKADLHCHTTCSDGTMSPKELLLHAKAIGLSGLCITDHDTVAAYQKAIPIAKEIDLLLGIGAEFSSSFKGTSVHILAYDFPFDNTFIADLCTRHRQRRILRNENILHKLRKFGFVIETSELPSSHDTIGRPHIAEIMVKKGYVTSCKEAFDRYLGDTCPCFDAENIISTEETIAIIHQAKGKAFIAHPHLIKHARKMKEILSLPFDGLECYYARFGRDQSEKFLKIAETKKWLVSGGSDFHGSHRAAIQLGSSWVDEERFRLIFSNL